MGELGTVLRDLADAAVRTEVPAGELTAVAAAARELTARLRAAGRGLHEVASVDDPEAGERWYSPVHGRGNPVAPALEAGETPGGRATGRVTVGKAHEGPPGLVHGGVVATLLDHLLARAVRAAGRGGLTATLTVRYRRPVPLGVPLLLTAEAGESSGRRTTATARVVAEDAPGTVLAEAEGLFVALRPERSAEVFRSLADPAGTWTARTGDAGA
ncbi:PaaI family thioesterase [Geodermatophilus pulveris]|uniref:PaaI family thioesterase n=1 Tax=Geodermatophilus pulveris TaxID=1564159 RepID=UPI001C5310B2|nr:PaaI family thioesterase [Geodermatophilus pulveris]